MNQITTTPLVDYWVIQKGKVYKCNLVIVRDMGTADQKKEIQFFAQNDINEHVVLDAETCRRVRPSYRTRRRYA